MPVYGVSDNLKNFVKSKGDVQKNEERIPGLECRLLDEDLYQENTGNEGASPSKK